MDISENGLKLIKQFEGCRLEAYKPVAAEKYYTIGYGHYGKDVYAGMHITQAQADILLRKDVAKFVAEVNSLKRNWTQNQFDALTSFTYNCGAGNLRTLTQGRTPAVIAEKLLMYIRGAGGRTLPGLVKRRQAERKLFLKPDTPRYPSDRTPQTLQEYKIGHIYHVAVRVKVRQGPGTSYRQMRHTELAASEAAFDKQKQGCMDVGTPIIPQDAKTVGTRLWLKITSGWVCARENDKWYIK